MEWGPDLCWNAQQALFAGASLLCLQTEVSPNGLRGYFVLCQLEASDFNNMFAHQTRCIFWRLCLRELGQTLCCQELVKMWKTFSILMLSLYSCTSYTQETNVTGVRFRPVGRHWNVICVWGSLCVCCTQGTGSCDLDGGVRKWN